MIVVPRIVLGVLGSGRRHKGMAMIQRWWLVLLAGLACFSALHAAPVRFQASGLGGVGATALLALDFLDGDGASNVVRAAGFSGDGSTTLQSQQGDVTGSLAAGLRLGDTDAFNEALLALDGVGHVGFVFDATGTPPPVGGFADAFSVFLLDTASGLSLVETDDPTGNDALLLYVIDGSSAGRLQVFNATDSRGVVWSALPADAGGSQLPEPSTLALLCISLAAAALLRLGKSLAAVLLAAALLCSGLVRAEDLTDSVQIARSGFVLNRNTGTFDSQITVTNRSPDTLLGPLKLVLAEALPANVALYNSQGRTAAGADYLLLPLVDGTLMPGASTVGTLRLLTSGQTVTRTTFLLDGRRLNAANTAQLEVTAVYPAGILSPQEKSVGAGYKVEVDGVLRGSTDAGGKLLLKVPVGAQVVAVTRAPSEGGSMTLPPLSAGAMVAVKVPLDDGKEISAGTLVRMDQAQQGLLARSATRVSLRFLRDEQPVRLVRISGVRLIDLLGNDDNLTPLFTLQPDGSIAAAPVPFFQALAGKRGQLRLEVSGSDATGAVHDDALVFHLADYRVRVQLVAPPSNPALPLAGIRITATVLNTGLRFNAQSDARGQFTLPDLPAGNLGLNGNSVVAGTVYNGVGTAAISKNSLVTLTMRGPQDMLNNVAPITVEALPATQAPAAGLGAAPAATPDGKTIFSGREAQARARMDAQRLPLPRAVPQTLMTGAAAHSISVRATGGPVDMLVQDSASFSVGKGVRTLTLRYAAATAEYPYYVLTQSIFNDVWSVSVFGGNGAPLFEITRQVNAQLSQEPVWRSDGSTGEIKQEIDVSALTASGDAQVIVRATSVNVGDGELATTATATLDASEVLRIDAIVPSPMPTNTWNDGSFYSVPLPGAANTLARSFTVDLTKPAGSTLTAVRVELRDGAGQLLMTVLPDAAPGTADVMVEAQTDTTARLRVRATVSSPVSSVAGAPPPARDLSYRVRVEATSAEGSALSDEKDAGGKRALWRIPAGLPRYGTRDSGGDDWVARGTYHWLLGNSSRLREIDDISGEHGRNLQHRSHARGTDIDAYHFYRFPGAGSGGQNHALLTDDLVLAFETQQQDPSPAAAAALARVAAWLAATRQGLADLVVLSSVAQVIHCDGVAGRGLPAGWCGSLLQTGTVSRVVGTQRLTLRFGGTLSHPKLMFRDDHNNHVHITLNAAQIGE